MDELILGDTLELLADHRGKTPKKLGTEFVPKGVPVASAMLVDNGRLNLHAARHVPHEAYVRWMKSPLRRGDVLLTSEAPLGRVARVQNDDPLVLGQRLFGLRGKPGILDSGFLFYALQSEKVRGDLIGRATGTTVVGIRQAALRHVKVPAPSYREQQAIAEVLGALDDKIAANTKLARTADQLAVSLFLQAAIGLGMSSCCFEDVALIAGGGTPRTSMDDYWTGGELPWATPTDVTALSGPYLLDTSRHITDLGLRNCSSALHPKGSILMASRATIGAFALAMQPMAANQGFIVVNARKPVLHWWLFHEMRSRVTEFESLANGATFLELSRGRFKKLSVRLPDDDVAAIFGEQAEALHHSASAALTENVSLARIRDTLLPQLMSGKLRVRDAEQLVEEVV